MEQVKSMREIIKRFLNEGVGAPELYHWTSFINVWFILHQNYLKGGHPVRDDSRTMNFDDMYGVSFTRDKFFHGWKNRHYPMEVCIVFDRDKLSNNYKLFPYNDFFDGIKKPKKKEADEMEERTNRSINKVIRYIKRIELYHKDGGASEEEILNYLKWYPSYRKCLDGFNYENYKSVDEFKEELCAYVESKGINCIIK